MVRCSFCGSLFKKKLSNSNIFEQLVCPHCLKRINRHKLTLGIGILHYKESEDDILRMLMSIDSQKRFDFSVLDLIVVTDEGGNKLDTEYIDSHLKNIKPRYLGRKRTKCSCGCGGNRNTIMKTLETDYVMFMDSDDVLHSNKVLSRIYKKINKYRPDLYCSCMREQLANGKFLTYNDLMSLNMTHGKAFKKDAFLRYNIWFDETIRVGEDLVCLAQFYNVCDNIYFDSGLISYDWLYNVKSITRNTGIDMALDSYYRCFWTTMPELNEWYRQIINKENKFINTKFITMMYNILYYRIKLTSKTGSELQEKYLKEFFKYTIYPIDFELSDELDRSLNRKLLRHMEYFSSAYKRYSE